jgi:prolyl 4-hydroxylase
MSLEDSPLPASALPDLARRLDDTLNDEPLDPLREAARAGQADAMSRLGDRLLVGRNAPFEPDEGVALVSAAAALGDLTALVRMATLTGAGAWTPQDWPKAFDFLVRAAQGGSALAQGQLLLLATDQDFVRQVRSDPAADPQAWRRLADSFDLQVWVTPPAGRRAMCEKPRIRVVDGFVSPEICAWLVDRAQGKLKPGLMFNGKEFVPMPTRSCSDFCFDILESDLVSLLVRLKISATTKLPVVAMEPTQVFHYALGQEIKAHYDHVRDALSLSGQSDSLSERIASFLIYLNDDYDGGDLHFSLVDFKFKGKTGDAIYFANVDEAGKAERLSLHAALPITRGEKWMISQWIQDRPTYVARA